MRGGRGGWGARHRVFATAACDGVSGLGVTDVRRWSVVRQAVGLKTNGGGTWPAAASTMFSSGVYLESKMSRLQKILDHTYFLIMLFLPYKGNAILEFLNFDLHFHITMNINLNHAWHSNKLKGRRA